MRIIGGTPRPTSIDELLDPRLAARLDALDVRSLKVFSGKLQGERRSKKRGQSVEFDDHRNYVPGDDLRFIDWNVYARLDKLFIKLFLEEEDLAVHVALDASPSMDAGLGEPASSSKRLHAARIAMALAYVGLMKQNRVGMTVFGKPVGGVMRLGDTRGRQQVQRAASFLMDAAFEGRSTSAGGGGGAAGESRSSGRTVGFNEALRRVAAERAGKGVFIVLSDFLDAEGYELGLRDLAAAGGYDTWCVQVLSPGELEPERLEQAGSLGIAGDVRLTDVETGVAKEVTVTPELVRRYKVRLGEFIDRLRKYCLSRDMEHLLVRTDEPVDRVVLETMRRRGVLG